MDDLERLGAQHGYHLERRSPTSARVHGAPWRERLRAWLRWLTRRIPEPLPCGCPNLQSCPTYQARRAEALDNLEETLYRRYLERTLRAKMLDRDSIRGQD